MVRNIEYVELTEEAVNRAGKYITEEVIGEGKLADAEHIACKLAEDS